VASSKTRQRKLERQRYERRMVRQAQQQRRKRQIQAGLGAFLTLALIALGVAWLTGVFDPDPPPPPESHECTWLPRDPAENPDRTDVGAPPEDPPLTGQRTFTIDLDAGGSGAGTVEVGVDVASDPCAAASMEHLATQGFFDSSTCHALVDGALHCGDPSGTGQGGPAYGFYGRNVPAPPLSPTATPAEEVEQPPTYPAGTVALADVTGENGSQFLIFYEDFTPETPLYPLFGVVTSGLELVEEIGAAGVKDETTEPVETVTIQSLTVADTTPTTSTPTEQPEG
jgi:peptidyl-prolyl cis-trans isomerase B (cyclophilin B)